MTQHTKCKSKTKTKLLKCIRIKFDNCASGQVFMVSMFITYRIVYVQWNSHQVLGGLIYDVICYFVVFVFFGNPYGSLIPFNSPFNSNCYMWYLVFGFADSHANVSKFRTSSFSYSLRTLKLHSNSLTLLLRIVDREKRRIFGQKIFK